MSLLLHSYRLCVYLLDIPRQPTCIKLGTGGLYQPIQSYMCKQGHLPRDIQQICCSTQTGQHEPCATYIYIQTVYRATHIQTVYRATHCPSCGKRLVSSDESREETRSLLGVSVRVGPCHCVVPTLSQVRTPRLQPAQTHIQYNTRIHG